MQSLTVLGRQPALGRAELESLYGADKLRPAGDQAVVVDVDPCLLAFDRLGGSVKFCKVLTTLDTVNWKELEQFLVQVSPDHSKRMPEGKMQLGLSAIGFAIKPEKLQATTLTLKKAIRKTGRSVRAIPNPALELNAAQVLHNKLTGPTGWELVMVRDGEQTIVAQTVKVQDIEGYAQRDRGRPKRDARVGMLPPKLAQIIINLAVGLLPESARQSVCEIPPDEPIPVAHFDQVVLDPFCGTGVVLQEAYLMGYGVYGSDQEKRMIEYSLANLEWLERSVDGATTSDGHVTVTGQNGPLRYQLEVGDATSHQWQPAPAVVASETYLGRTFMAKPETEILGRTVAECNLIIKKFLQNLYGQVKAGTRLCLAVPAWQTSPGQFKLLPLVDQISDLGYNRIKLKHASEEELIYYRNDQFVARQLLVITRK